MYIYFLIYCKKVSTVQHNLNTTPGVAFDVGKILSNYQRSRRLTADGIVGCNTWLSLQEDVVGRGRTTTTIDQEEK